MPEEAYYGANILGVLNLVAKLFNRKNRYKAPIYQPITYRQMYSLFNNSTIFNDRLLKNEMKIPLGKTKLFFHFCRATDISSERLIENKQMELLELLIANSKTFLKILEEFEKKKFKKD